MLVAAPPIPAFLSFPPLPFTLSHPGVITPYTRCSTALCRTRMYPIHLSLNSGPDHRSLSHDECNFQPAVGTVVF